MSNALRADQAPRIWTPTGMVDRELRKAQRVVEQYDERLMLARHEGTGDWCVWLKPKANPFGDLPYPVIGLGPTLPSPEEIERQIVKADAARRGDEILREINAANDKLRAEKERAADDASGQGAEALEWGFRKMSAHPTPRIFVPRSV